VRRARLRWRLLRVASTTLGVSLVVVLVAFGVLMRDRLQRIDPESSWRTSWLPFEQDLGELVLIENRVDRRVDESYAYRRALWQHWQQDMELEELGNLAHLLEQRPNDASLYLSRARLYEGAGKTEAARSDYRAALRLDPSSREAKFELALLCIASPFNDRGCGP
jgi:tetratricopeptide (TPR) repeat protein